MPRLFLLIWLMGVGATPVLAVQPDEVLPDQQLETRARNLSRELRCMVCQNQSIDDSDASLARDLRVLVRERLNAGDTDQQVLDYLTARYGDFVLLKPRFDLQTALLWLLPAAFVATGVVVLIGIARRQPNSVNVEAKLTPAEQARLDDLVRSKNRYEENGT
jgi:cytochrome c-type biogenesis protein CcmH